MEAFDILGLGFPFRFFSGTGAPMRRTYSWFCMYEISFGRWSTHLCPELVDAADRGNSAPRIDTQF